MKLKIIKKAFLRNPSMRACRGRVVQGDTLASARETPTFHRPDRPGASDGFALNLNITLILSDVTAVKRRASSSASIHHAAKPTHPRASELSKRSPEQHNGARLLRAASSMLAARPPIPLIRKPPENSTPTDGRTDSRKPDQLRPLKLRTGVISCASGSAMLELANTKVICAVYGPNATEGRDYLDKGQLECTFRFTSFARRARRDKRKELNGSAEEKTLSLELAAALSASVQLDRLPKSIISVHALVLCDDGSALPAAISCASLALADASIHLYGLVAAASCALLPRPAAAPSGGKAAKGGNGDGGEEAEAALDATAAELSRALGVVQIACMPSLDRMTLVRHQGSLPLPRLTETMQRALAGCTLLHEQMAAAIKVKAAGEEGEGEGTPGRKRGRAEA